MRKRLDRSSRAAMTLVEVVAGLALMGSLLAVAIVASNKHMRQMKIAQEKQAATVQLDRFLAAWSNSGFDRENTPAINRAGRFRIRIREQFGRTAPQLQSRVLIVEAKSISLGQVVAWAEILTERTSLLERAKP